MYVYVFISLCVRYSNFYMIIDYKAGMGEEESGRPNQGYRCPANPANPAKCPAKSHFSRIFGRIEKFWQDF